MAAVYYGYRKEGSAVWYLFSGELVRSEADDVYWELEADLHESSNGEPVNGEIDSATIACGSVDDLADFYSGSPLSGHSGEDPMCFVWSFAGNPPDESRVYYMPVGNMGDRRFTAASEDGWIMEGYRLMYD